MSKLDAFRKLIREEVRQVMREELKSLLSEIRKPEVAPKKTPIPASKEVVKKESPKVDINETALNSKDPIQRLLAETALGMNADEYKTMVNASANMAQNFPQMAAGMMQGFGQESRVVQSVTDMVSTSRPAADVSQVQIDAVPDFTNLMKTMKNNGQI